MLARLHDRAREGLGLPEQAWPETDGPGIIALAQRNPDSQTVTLILDATTASTVLFAIAAHADEREAHIREVEQFAQTLPEDSYGRRNRHRRPRNPGSHPAPRRPARLPHRHRTRRHIQAT
jgi:hypothetical protein